MNSTLLKPDCNLSTVKDGRGVIFSFYPDAPIVELVSNTINAGKVKGFHCHPEFDEYVMVSSGRAIETYRDENGNEQLVNLGPGSCLKIPAGVYHALYAITDCVAVMGLTKRWNDCEQPIIQETQ